MTAPSVAYDRIIRALRRAGWVVVLQKGCHVRLQKQTATQTLELIVPALRPVLGSTLVHILLQARLSVEEFTELL